MDPPTDAPPKAPRMSIKFNTSKPSGKPNGPKPSSSLGKRSRPSALGGSDSESERGSDRSDDDRSGGRIVFADDRRQRDGRRDRDRGRDRGGRRDHRSPARGERIVIGDAPKIIRPPEQSRRPKMRGRVVGGRNGESVTKDVEPADEDKEVKWGLNVTKKPSSASPRQDNTSTEKPEQEDKPKEPKTVDEQAMDRLMGKSSPGAEKVITLSEKDAYSRDVADAPPPDDMEAETGIDVMEFGAAMLRGMGWDGEFSRPGFKQANRRPNQLGLGAKELKEKEDLGGWNHKGKGDRPKRLADYRREKEKERESRGGRDSYKRERERERRYEREDRRYERDDRRYGRDERRRY